MPFEGGNFEPGQYVVVPMEYLKIPKPSHPRHIAPLQRPDLRYLRHIVPLFAMYLPYDILPPFGQKGGNMSLNNLSGVQHVMEPGGILRHSTARSVQQMHARDSDMDV